MFNSIDFRDISKVILKNNKILAPIKTFRGDRAINIAVDKLY